MIINGSSNRCVWWWTQHLESKDNDRVRIKESHGLRSESVRGMLEEMQTMAAGTDCRNFFYQMNLNLAPGEELMEQQWDRIRQIAEKQHRLEGQPYFVIEHVKHGRPHPHYVYLRVNLETGLTISDSHDARKNHAIAREVEREFGLQKTIGPYDLEPGMQRPKRGPKRWESYRAAQSGLSIEDIEAQLTRLRQQCDSGKAFHAGLEREGYILALGDRMTAGQRTLMIIDSAGDEHALARRLNMKTKDLSVFMREVDRAALPGIAQAQAMRQQRTINQLEADRATVRDEIQWEQALDRAGIEKEERERRFVDQPQKEISVDARTSVDRRAGREEIRAGQQEKQQQPVPAPELGKTQGEIRLARILSDGPQSFANALEDRGYILARVTPEDIDREMEKLREEWEECRRNPQTWMEHEGGYHALTPGFQETARRSYAEWKTNNEAKQDRQRQQGKPRSRSTSRCYRMRICRFLSALVRRKYFCRGGSLLERYEFVQNRWLEGPKSQLERAMGGLCRHAFRHCLQSYAAQYRP